MMLHLPFPSQAKLVKSVIYSYFLHFLAGMLFVTQNLLCILSGKAVYFQIQMLLLTLTGHLTLFTDTIINTISF